MLEWLAHCGVSEIALNILVALPALENLELIVEQSLAVRIMFQIQYRRGALLTGEPLLLVLARRGVDIKVRCQEADTWIFRHPRTNAANWYEGVRQAKSAVAILQDKFVAARDE